MRSIRRFIFKSVMEDIAGIALDRAVQGENQIDLQIGPFGFSKWMSRAKTLNKNKDFDIQTFFFFRHCSHA